MTPLFVHAEGRERHAPADRFGDFRSRVHNTLNDLAEIAAWRHSLQRQPGDWLIGPRHIVRRHQTLLAQLCELDRQTALLERLHAETENFVDELDGKLY